MGGNIPLELKSLTCMTKEAMAEGTQVNIRIPLTLSQPHKDHLPKQRF